MKIPNHPFFATLTPRESQYLLSCAIKKNYQKGEFVLHQGTCWKNALFLLSGEMEWTILSPSGKRQIVFRVRRGDMVWGHSLFDDAPMPASLEVTQNTSALFWTKEPLLTVLRANPQASLQVTGELVASMRRVRELLYGFAFHPVSGRLARLLLRHYQPQENGYAVSRDLTLDEMAHSVGTTRELISKTLHRFADEGIIHISRTKFTFLDTSALERIAKEK